MRRYDCRLYDGCLDAAALKNGRLDCDDCARFYPVPEAHEEPLFSKERKENPMKETCKIEGCHTKVVARDLCPLHYDRWRHGKEEVIRAMGGPFQIVRPTAPHKETLKKRMVANAKAAVAREKDETIAPGSKVVKKIMDKASASSNGDLQKAVDLLIAQGFLAEELLKAARVMVRYESKSPLP